jgi:L-threonylcarbamoyladenylate synthase
MLRDSVGVYLDGGPSQTGVASTIVDATSLVGGPDPKVRVLRAGAIDRARLREILGDLLDGDPDDTVADPAPASESTADIPDAAPQPGGGGA